MATIPYHTHTFSIPTASTADIEEGVSTSTVITPAELKPLLPVTKNVAEVGIVSGAEDITSLANTLYAGLSDATVIWPPGIFHLRDGNYIAVRGNNVKTVFSPGTIFRQHTWGRPVFVTSDPDDSSVRPTGITFTGPARFEAYDGEDPIYYHDAFLGVSEAGPIVMESSPLATTDNIFVFRNNTLLELGVGYTLGPLGGSTLTVTLAAPNGATEYVVVKVTNKWDRFSHPTDSIFNQEDYNRANESAPIWHGGGDNFLVEGYHVEGFVSITTVEGSWNSELADVHTSNVVIQDITFNNCEYTLTQECDGLRISRIKGGKITESQTDDGLRNIYNPSGLLNPVFKDPHVSYTANGATLSPTRNLILEDLEGDNKYSSNYKVRNAETVVIRGGNIDEYLRVMDIDGVTRLEADFGIVKGAIVPFRDSQRCMANLAGVQDASIRIKRLECVGDVVSAIRADTGRTPGVPGTRRVCQGVRVEIGSLLTNGSASRTSDWIINHGATEFYVRIGLLTQNGADTGYVYRCRDSGEDLGSGFVGASRGGISVDRIRLTTARTLRLARLSTENSTVANGVLVEFNKAKVSGSVTYTTATINNLGTNTRIIVDGVDTMNFQSGGISPRKFGAVLNGSTDDTAALVLTIAAAKATKSPIILGPGEVLLNTARHDIDYDGFVLKGGGAIHHDLDDEPIFTWGTDSIQINDPTIENITLRQVSTPIDLYGAGDSGVFTGVTKQEWFGAVFAWNTNRAVFRRVTCEDFFKMVKFDGKHDGGNVWHTNVVVENCLAIDCTYLVLGNAFDGAAIEFNTTRGYQQVNTDDGVILKNPHLIYVSDRSMPDSKNVRVIGNAAEGLDEGPAYVFRGLERSIVSGNTSAGEGMIFADTCTKVIFTDNKHTSTKETGDAFQSGIEAKGCKYCTFADMIIDMRGFQGYGLRAVDNDSSVADEQYGEHNVYENITILMDDAGTDDKPPVEIRTERYSTFRNIKVVYDGVGGNYIFRVNESTITPANLSVGCRIINPDIIITNDATAGLENILHVTTASASSILLEVDTDRLSFTPDSASLLDPDGVARYVLNGIPQLTRTITTDADATVGVLTHSPNIVHSGTLTADRAITLSTTGAVPGSRFRITRTGAGAFNLNVGTGPLKALATGTWAEFVYTGSAWYLAAYGTL